MLRVIKPNPRKPHQAKAYKALLENRLVWITKQITNLQDELVRVRQEINDPKEHDHYCDDCGTGHSSDRGARQCCDERHP